MIFELNFVYFILFWFNCSIFFSYLGKLENIEIGKKECLNFSVFINN